MLHIKTPVTKVFLFADPSRSAGSAFGFAAAGKYFMRQNTAMPKDNLQPAGTRRRGKNKCLVPDMNPKTRCLVGQKIHGRLFVVKCNHCSAEALKSLTANIWEVHFSMQSFVDLSRCVQRFIVSKTVFQLYVDLGASWLVLNIRVDLSLDTPNPLKLVLIALLPMAVDQCNLMCSVTFIGYFFLNFLCLMVTCERIVIINQEQLTVT